MAIQSLKRLQAVAKASKQTAAMSRQQADQKLNQLEKALETARKIANDPALEQYVEDNSKKGDVMLDSIRTHVSEAENDLEELVELLIEGK